MEFEIYFFQVLLEFQFLFFFYCGRGKGVEVLDCKRKYLQTKRDKKKIPFSANMLHDHEDEGNPATLHNLNICSPTNLGSNHSIDSSTYIYDYVNSQQNYFQV